MEKLKALTPSEVFAPYYKPPIGSIRFSLNLVSQMVGAAADQVVDDAQLRARIDDAVDKTEEAARLQFQWTSHQRLDSMRREGVMEADNAADRALSALYTQAEGNLKLSPSNVRHQAAERLLALVMPRGVGVITSQRFEMQHTSTDIIMEQLDGPGRADVQVLGLEPFVEELREANRVYGEHLSSLDNVGVTHPEVKAAYRAALDAFFGVVMTVWSNYLERPETRNQLLAPVYEQNERIRAYIRSRKKTPRVDSKTGEFIEEEEGAAETEAESVLDMVPNSAVDTPAEDLV